MNPTRRTRRQGFTLLEIVLALAIGMMLLGAVYFSLDIYLRTTQAGRTQVAQSKVGRAVVKRLTSDITMELPMIPPVPSPLSNGGKGGKGGAGGAASGGSGSAGSAGSTSTASSNTTGNPPSPYVYNLGVQGDQNTLTLYISKASLSNITMPTDGSQQQLDQPIDSDLRQITYCLITDGQKKGLARQEIAMVTSTDTTVGSVTPSADDPNTKIIAEGVIGFTVEYFDGTNWQTSWDGTTYVTNPNVASAQTASSSTSASTASSTGSGTSTSSTGSGSSTSSTGSGSSSSSAPTISTGLSAVQDGSSGTGQSATGVMPPTALQPWLGPPLAIRITLKIAPETGMQIDPNDPRVLTFKHVIDIPTAVVGYQTASGNMQDNTANNPQPTTSGNGQ